MEEQKDKKVCDCHGCKCAAGGANGCGCGCGHWHGRHGFFILRIVIAIIVVVAAFWIGMRLGELRAAYYGAGYGRGHQMMGGYYGRAGGAPMMPYYGAPAATSTLAK